jgi:hypothetical protein
LEIREGLLGCVFAAAADIKKGRGCFANFLYFNNLFSGDLSVVSLIQEPYIAKKQHKQTITQEDLDRLKKLVIPGGFLWKRKG